MVNHWNNVGKPMIFLPPIFLGMGTIPPINMLMTGGCAMITRENHQIHTDFFGHSTAFICSICSIPSGNLTLAIENHHCSREQIHYFNGDLSIVMLVYQRVCSIQGIHGGLTKSKGHTTDFRIQTKKNAMNESILDVELGNKTKLGCFIEVVSSFRH